MDSLKVEGARGTLSTKNSRKANTKMDFRELAKLHSEGWALHWLRENSKVPLLAGWTRGSRLSFEQLKKSYRPGLNVGVRLGTASKLIAGGVLAVFDVDVKGAEPRHAKEAEQKLFEICPEAKNAPTVLSGRGNGSRHVYVRTKTSLRGNELKAKSQEIVKVKMPSVDPSKRELEALSVEELAAGYRLRPAWEVGFMSEGRQVVAPGSVHPDTGCLYRWAHGASLSERQIPFIRSKMAESAALAPSDMPEPRSRFLDVDVNNLGLKPEQVMALVEGEGVEDRSAEIFKLAMAILRRGHSEDVVLSVLTNQGYFLGRTAFDHAKTKDRVRAAHWIEKYTLPKARAQVEEAHFDSVEEVGAKPPRPEKTPLTILPFDTLSPSLENPLTLVEGLLGHSGLSLLFGPSGAGKSFFAVYLTFCIAMSRKFFGKQTAPSAALYFAVESALSIQRRLVAYKKSENLSKAPIGIVPSSVSLIEDASRIIAAIEAFSAQTGMKVQFVVVDTLARASAGSDENSAKDVSALIKSLDHVREVTGAHIMLVHHAGKDVSKGARGSSALRAACDSEIFLENFKATVTKQRDGEIGEKLFYDLRPILIGTDSDGEEISVPIVRELESVNEVKPLKGQKKLALELLQKLSISGKQVAYSDWQAEFVRAAKTKGGPSPKTLQRSFRKAEAHLRANGFITKDGLLRRVSEVGP